MRTRQQDFNSWVSSFYIPWLPFATSIDVLGGPLKVSIDVLAFEANADIVLFHPGCTSSVLACSGRSSLRGKFKLTNSGEAWLNAEVGSGELNFHSSQPWHYYLCMMDTHSSENTIPRIKKLKAGAFFQLHLSLVGSGKCRFIFPLFLISSFPPSLEDSFVWKCTAEPCVLQIFILIASLFLISSFPPSFSAKNFINPQKFMTKRLLPIFSRNN